MCSTTSAAPCIIDDGGALCHTLAQPALITYYLLGSPIYLMCGMFRRVLLGEVVIHSPLWYSYLHTLLSPSISNPKVACCPGGKGLLLVVDAYNGVPD